MKVLLWGVAIGAIYFAIAVWIRRRNKLQSVWDLNDADLRHVLRRTMLWSSFAGACFSSVILLGMYVLTGSRLPAWIPPQTMFIPMMLAQISLSFATRPPRRTI